MNNKHQELIAEKVAEFDKFLDQYTGKHNLDGLYATLFADTVKVRKDLIIKDYAQTLQDTIDTVLKEEREEIGAMIEEADYARKVGERTGEPIAVWEVQDVIRQIKALTPTQTK